MAADLGIEVTPDDLAAFSTSVPAGRPSPIGCGPEAAGEPISAGRRSRTATTTSSPHRRSGWRDVRVGRHRPAGGCLQAQPGRVRTGVGRIERAARARSCTWRRACSTITSRPGSWGSPRPGSTGVTTGPGSGPRHRPRPRPTWSCRTCGPSPSWRSGPHNRSVAKLSDTRRAQMPKSAFAYIDSRGTAAPAHLRPGARPLRAEPLQPGPVRVRRGSRAGPQQAAAGGQAPRRRPGGLHRGPAPHRADPGPG